MRLAQITTLFDASPTIRLLGSDSAPFVIDFLNLTFKKAGLLTAGHEDLKQQLLIYIEHLHETDPDYLKGPADRYLLHWSDSGWLNRHLQSSAAEPQYQLTRHAEDAIQFIDHLISRRTGLVGTESRLRLIIDTLTDLVHGASSDPDKRLAYLEQQRDAIQREIDALHHGRPVDVYKPSQIRERFQMAVGLLKTLQSDFRAVEERFHGIAMRVQHEQQAALETRGQILGKAMDAEDVLKTEDEGISFYAFIAFLFSPDGQQTLRQTIDEVTRLEAIQDERDSIMRLRSMVRSLLTDYFGRLGLVLVVNEEDGMAWLHQPDAEELPADYESIPKLFHKVALGFEGTLLCVVLRDELRRNEEEDLQNDRCVVKQSDLLETWRLFFPEDSDEVRLNDGLSKQLARLEKLKFVRRFEKSPASWEVRRILKARLPLESLKTIRSELQSELTRRQGGQG